MKPALLCHCTAERYDWSPAVCERPGGWWVGWGLKGGWGGLAQNCRVQNTRFIFSCPLSAACEATAPPGRTESVGYGAPTRRPFAVITAIINLSGGRRKPRRVMPEMPPMRVGGRVEDGPGGGGGQRTVREEGGAALDGR